MFDFKGRLSHVFKITIFCVNRPLSYTISQQQLQWAAHVVPWVASTYLNVKVQIVPLRKARAHRAACTVLFREAPDYVGAHQIKHAHSF